MSTSTTARFSTRELQAAADALAAGRFATSAPAPTTPASETHVDLSLPREGRTAAEPAGTVVPVAPVVIDRPDGIGPMEVGDTVEVEIEGIGVLRNRVGAR